MRDSFGSLFSIYSALTNSDIKNRLVNNSFWSIIGNVIIQGTGFGVAVVAARILGKTIYGELGILNSIILLLSLLFNFGLGLTSTKFIAENFKKDKSQSGKLIGFLYLTSIGISLTLFIIYFLFLYKIPVLIADAPHLSIQIRVCGLVILLYSIINTQTGILMGFEGFKSIVKVNVIRGTAVFLFSAAGIYFWQLNGAIFGLIAEGTVVVLINHLLINKIAQSYNISIQYSIIKNYYPLLWKFSFPAFLSSLVVPFAIWATNSFLINSPNGFAELGQYNVVNQWKNIILFIPMTINNAILPLLSSEISKQNLASPQKIIKLSLIINGLSSFLLALVLIIGNDYFMSIFGNEYLTSPLTTGVILFSAVISSVIAPIGQWIVASNKMWLALIMNFGWCLILLVASWIFIKNGSGAIGLGASFLIAYFFHALWVIGYYNKYNHSVPRIPPND
ncbi:MAG: hypothetical protein D9V45_05825 [Chloroflexi bacterium]|nr:MAG: hypothetical protein D9V45_05825 [Chloroflexota bacterium]